jgi:hypothetical protein
LAAFDFKFIISWRTEAADISYRGSDERWCGCDRGATGATAAHFSFHAGLMNGEWDEGNNLLELRDLVSAGGGGSVKLLPEAGDKIGGSGKLGGTQAVACISEWTTSGSGITSLSRCPMSVSSSVPIPHMVPIPQVAVPIPRRSWSNWIAPFNSHSLASSV